MKKILLAALIISPLPAMATPYVGVEYGYGSVNHDFEPQFAADNMALNPDLDDGIATAFVGYAFNESWALELGYSQYELDDSRSNDLGIVSVDGKDYWQEMDWDSSIKTKQISLAPVYTYAMDDKWSVKFKAGVTYTQYQSKAGKYEELELLINDDVEINNMLSHHSQSTNEWGGMIAFGTEYEVLPQLSIGANVKYQADSYANTASFNVSTAYYF
ncbi:AcfA family outer membrane beta-barrel protein [Vibrio sp. R78045]|uniref:AcfA family outer membrane beta-barrel protein n=1 Tax=Vibrio sp. R78045 TaxID=3093868 RepID=UPI0036F24A56